MGESGGGNGGGGNGGGANGCGGTGGTGNGGGAPITSRPNDIERLSSNDSTLLIIFDTPQTSSETAESSKVLVAF